MNWLVQQTICASRLYPSSLPNHQLLFEMQSNQLLNNRFQYNFGKDSGISQTQDGFLRIDANPCSVNVDNKFIPNLRRVQYVYSFGLLGYRRTSNKKGLDFLLVQHAKNKGWSFPKGRMEKGESPFGHDTAPREFSEETGIKLNDILAIKYDAPFITHYCYVRSLGDSKNGTRQNELVKKWTTIFVAKIKANAQPRRVRPKEIGDVQWLSYESAIEKSTLETRKKIIRGVCQVIFQEKRKNELEYYLEENIPQMVQEYEYAKEKLRHAQLDEQQREQQTRDCVFKKYDQFERGLIQCNKINTVIGKDEIIHLSLKLLNIAKKMTSNQRSRIAERQLIDWLFPTPCSFEQFAWGTKMSSPNNETQVTTDNHYNEHLVKINQWIDSTTALELKTAYCEKFDSFVVNYQNILQ